MISLRGLEYYGRMNENGAKQFIWITIPIYLLKYVVLGGGINIIFGRINLLLYRDAIWMIFYDSELDVRNTHLLKTWCVGRESPVEAHLESTHASVHHEVACACLDPRRDTF